MGMLVQLFLGAGGCQSRVTSAPFAAGSKQVPVADNICPVEFTGVVHTQHDLAQTAEDGQSFQGLAWQRGHTKHNDPPGQMGWPVRSGQIPPPFQKTGMDAGPAGGRQLTGVRHQLPPQLRLPAQLLVQFPDFAPGQLQLVATLFPVRKPVGPEHLILVKKVGDLLRQLITAHLGFRAFHKAAQRRKHRLVQQGRQHPVESPDQPGLVERRLLRHFPGGQHSPVGLPDKPGGKQEIHTGRYPEATPCAVSGLRIFRQSQLQPLGNTVTLNQENFPLQRWQGRLPADPDHRVAQVLQVVGVQGMKARLDMICVGHEGTFPVLRGDSGSGLFCHFLAKTALFCQS